MRTITIDKEVRLDSFLMNPFRLIFSHLNRVDDAFNAL